MSQELTPEILSTIHWDVHVCASAKTDKIFSQVIADQLRGSQLRENRIVLHVSPVDSPVSRSSSELARVSRKTFKNSFSGVRDLARVSRETFIKYVARASWSASAACRRRTMSMHSSSFSSASSVCKVSYSATVSTSRLAASSVYRGHENRTHPAWSRGAASSLSLIHI